MALTFIFPNFPRRRKPRYRFAGAFYHGVPMLVLAGSVVLSRRRGGRRQDHRHCFPNLVSKGVTAPVDAKKVFWLRRGAWRTNAWFCHKPVCRPGASTC
jgi:hypothetical protein